MEDIIHSKRVECEMSVGGRKPFPKIPSTALPPPWAGSLRTVTNAGLYSDQLLPYFIYEPTRRPLP